MVPARRSARFATGIFNSGTNVGALVTPLVVPWIALHWGWQWAFVVTGLIGFFWLSLVARVLPSAGDASAAQPGRARLHPQRPAGPG